MKEKRERERDRKTDRREKGRLPGWCRREMVRTQGQHGGKEEMLLRNKLAKIKP